MANKIQVKRSAVPSKVPTTADLDLGEIAINTYDGIAYIKKDNGTASIVPLGGSSGDVAGPSSATDNALVRFDGTTGKLIQNGTITQDDTGNLAGILSEQYDITNAPPAIVEGLEAWDSGNGTLEVGLKGGVVSYKYGQQEFVRAYNGSGATMTKGQVVYIVGAQGNRVDVRLAKADAESTSAGTIGFVAESIAAGAEGWVQVSGSLYKLDTSALTAGQPLYLSAATAGAYTTTRPTAPNHTVILGWVQRVSATVGSFYVKVDNGYELDELHNVLITSAASGNTLIYDATAGVWKNANLTAGTGISVTNGAGSITVANTGVTSVGVSVPTGLSVSGTPVTTTGTIAISYAAGYSIPTTASQTNWDSAYTQRLQWDGGSTNLVAATGRTSLGATTVGGNMFTLTNPSAITFPRFNADNTVSALDAATFRTAIGAGTGSGSVTSVSMTTPTGLTVSGSPITGSGTLALTLTTGYSIPTTASQTNWDSAYTQRLQWDGGSTNLVAATGRTSLGATTLGSNFFTLTNVAAIAFPRINADNTISTLDAATFRSAIGAGTGSVTSVATAGTVSGLTLTGGTITTTGTITLGGTLSVTPSNFASQTANTFLAAPNGAAGTPTFRAIAAADVPTLNQNTSGYANYLNSAQSSTDVGAISSRINSGFYQNSSPTTGGGWPVTGSWYHLLSSTHSNTANYYAMQFSADFYSNTLYYRSTAGSGTTGWARVILDNNIGSQTVAALSGTANSAALSANTSGSYGSWNVGGSRGNWYGMRFDSGSTVMVNGNDGGRYYEGYGWQYEWYNGTMYIGKNAYGGNTYTNWDSSNLPAAWSSTTVAIQGSSAGFSTVSYTSNTLYYIRIGNWCFWRLYLNAYSVTGGSGTLLVTGFPYTAVIADTLEYGQFTYCDCGSATTMGMAAPRYVNGQSYITLFRPKEGFTPVSGANLTAANVATATGIVAIMQGGYQIA